jgi:putative salt-induced outer membrane protein YdiY
MCCQNSLSGEPMTGRRAVFQSSQQNSRLQLWGLVLIWLLTATCSRADKIVLMGGDVIEGVITQQRNDAVVLEHSDLGRMEIPRSRIKSLKIDTPDVEVVLTDGDTIQGRLVEENEATIVLEHRDLGRMEISRDRIVSSTVGVPEATVVMAGGDTIEGRLIERTDTAIVLDHPTLGRLEIPRERIDSLEVKEPEFKKEEKLGPLEPQLNKLSGKASRIKEKGWTASADLSWDSKTGNINEQSTRFGSHIGRTLPDRETGLDLSYYHKIADGDVSDNKLTIGLGRDWFYPDSRWFRFASGRFDHDQFESWQQRVNVQVGPGYHLIKNGDMSLDARLGLGPRREWGSENDEVKAEGLIGVDFEWKTSDRKTLKVSPHFFPVVGDLDDYRARVSGEWRFLFDKATHLGLVLGTLYEYQSVADPDKDHGDLRTYIGLQFGL